MCDNVRDGQAYKTIDNIHRTGLETYLLVYYCLFMGSRGYAVLEWPNYNAVQHMAVEL